MVDISVIRTAFLVLVAAFAVSLGDAAADVFEHRKATYEGDKSCAARFPADANYERAKLNIVNQACWACPKGYKRTLNPSPRAAKACKKGGGMRYIFATRHGKAKFLKKCGSGRFSEEGFCWSCPSGYKRAPLRNDGKGQASCKRRLTTYHSPATRRGEGGCAKGQWSPSFSGKCYSCPTGYKRNLTRLNHDRDNDPKACVRFQPPAWFAKSFVSERKAKLDAVLEANKRVIELAAAFVANLKEVRSNNGSAEGLRAMTAQEFLDAGGGEMLQAACENSFCTVTITAGADGSYFVGANVSGGIAWGTVWETDDTDDGNDIIDSNKDLASAGVLTANLSGGASVGGDGGINIGFWRPRFNAMKGFGHGIVVGGSAYAVGGNASAWWIVQSNFELFDWGTWFDFAEEERDEFAGFSIGWQGGLSAEGEYNWGYTWNWGDAVE